MTSETIAVRQGEGLDVDQLTSFIRERLPEAPEGEPDVRQFSAGHSNLTYLLRIGDWEAVLRRPPLGPVAPKAHDMKREYQVLKAINTVFIPAPKPYIFTEDETVIGSPFFIMERRNGIVLDTDFPGGINYTPGLGKKISQLMVDRLAELHHIDYRKTALAGMAQPDGFINRQVEGWIGRYNRAKTGEVAGVGLLIDYLSSNIPESGTPAVIHYDYKLNNAMFSEDFSEMTGLFDWEMATVGDPLADVAAAMSYWIQADDLELLRKGLGKPPVTVMEGFYTREEFIRAYAEKSGRDISNIDYYLTFAYFKLAVICQQIYYRFRNGQTKDPRFAHFGNFVENLILHASKEIRT